MAPRASLLLVAAVALAMGARAHAGSLSVLDADGSQWRVIEDPADEAQGYVLRRIGPDGRPDLRFGRDGQRAVAISPTNDAPTSLRVDAAGRLWLSGASIAANQPVAVIERLTPDGCPDIQWGVQGKVELSPGGIAVKPNDLLPLADGSVLVAGVAANLEPARAIVFRLRGDGTLDTAFGDRGTWLPPLFGESSTATGLDVGGDGSVAVSAVSPGTPGRAEIWQLDEHSPRRVLQQPLDDGRDGEDLRLAWSGRRWQFGPAGTATLRVGPAYLHPPELPPGAGASAVASDPGQGGFSPFADEDGAPRPAQKRDEDAVPWMSGALAVVSGLAIAGALALRGRVRRR